MSAALSDVLALAFHGIALQYLQMKRALITGITGQDGSYLADLLLEKGYEVHGIIRRASTFNTSRIDHLYADPHVNGVRMFLHYGDLSDSVNLVKLLYELKPDEIYHLGAQSHVRVSFDIPEYTRTSPVSAPFVSWKRSAKPDCVPAFFRHRAAKCSARPRRYRKTRRRRSGRAAPTGGQGFCVLGDRELSRELRSLREQRHHV